MSVPTRILILTLIYFFIELLGGICYNSAALVTDSAFMAIDLMGQFSAIYAKILGQRPPDKHKTFGYERIKVLSGLANGILVGFLLLYVFINAYQRISRPEQLDIDKVFIISVIGLLVNVYGAYKLYQLSSSINMRGSFVIVLNDALSSVGVILSTLIIKFTGWFIVDAISSILIALLVIYPTYCLVRDSIHILMQGIPQGMDIKKVEQFIYENFEAKKVKDLRIWVLVPGKTILTVKIRTEGKVYNREKIRHLKKLLQERFTVHDVFVEVYEHRSAIQLQVSSQ